MPDFEFAGQPHLDVRHGQGRAAVKFLALCAATARTDNGAVSRKIGKINE